MDNRIKELLEKRREEMVHSLQRLVKIRSVEGKAGPGMPFGRGIKQALETALEIAGELNLRTRNLDGYAGYVEIGQGEKMLGILCHLDVVPEGRGWKYPPYAAEVHDGKLYGRGAVDNKGPAVAALYALKAVEESGYQLNNRVRLILGTDEESGWQGLQYYLEHDESPDTAFSPDAEFPVIHGEKGILTFTLSKTFAQLADKLEEDSEVLVRSIKGGNAPNMVPDYCTAELETAEPEKLRERLVEFCRQNDYQMELEESAGEKGIFLLKSEGVSAHGSLPESGQNAVSQLILFLDSLNLPEDDLKGLINFYAARIGTEYYGQAMGCGFKDELSGRLTFNVGMIDIDREKGEMVINIRYPVTLTREEVYRPIRKAISSGGFSLTENGHKAPLYLPADDPLVTGLMAVYRRLTGDQSAPVTIGGGTYARALKKAVAFGPLFPGQVELAHQKDEYMAVDDLFLNARIYAASIIELSSKY